jgi:hypothetical protein
MEDNIQEDALQPMEPIEDTAELSNAEIIPDALPSQIAETSPVDILAPAEETMAQTGVSLAAEAAGIDPQTINKNNPNDLFRLLDEAFRLKGEARRAAVTGLLSNPDIPVGTRIYVGNQLATMDLQDRTIQSVEDVYKGAAYINQLKEESLLAREGTVNDAAMADVEFNATPQGRGVQMASANVTNGKQAVSVARTKVAITKEDVYRESVATMRYVDNKAELSRLLNPFTAGKTMAEIGQLFVPVVGSVTVEAQALSGLATYSGIPELNEMVSRWDLAGVRAGQAILNIGQFNRDLRETVNNLSPEKQLQLVQSIRRYADTTGFKKLTGGNGFIEQTIVEKLIGGLLIPPEEKETRGSTILRYAFDHLETGVGWLEGTGIGLAASTSIKTSKMALKGSLKSVFGMGEYSRMTKVAPETTSRGVANAVLAGDEGKKALGIDDLGEVVEQAMPTSPSILKESNAKINILDEMKERIAASQSQIAGNLSKILENSVVTINPTRAAAGVAEKIGRHHMVHRPDLSSIEAGIDVAEDGATISGLYGRSKEEGYKTLDELRQATSRIFGTDEDGAIQLVLRHKDSGAVIKKDDPDFADIASDVAASPELGKEFEWFAQIDQKIPTSEMANWDEMIDPTFIVTKTFKEEKVPTTRGEKFARKVENVFRSPALQRVHRNINSIYSLWKQDVGGALKQAEGNQRIAQELVLAMFEPELARLNAKDSLNLNRAIEAGQGKTTRWTDDELGSQFGLTSNNGKAAYFAYRNATEFMYKIANLKASESMAKEDFFHIIGTDGARIGFGRPIRNSVDLTVNERSNFRSVPVRVIDGEKEEIVRMSTGQIDDAIKTDGDVMYAMRQAEFVDDIEVGYTLIKQSANPSHSKRVRSGDKVIDYVDGYYTNAVNAPIAIRAQTSSGRKYLIGTANTAADARKAVEELKSNPDIVKKYGDDIKDEPLGGYRDYIASSNNTREMYENWGGRVFGKKDSPQGKGPIDFSNREKPANFEAPVEATIKSFMMIAGVYTKGEMIQFMERALGKHAQQYGLLRSPGARKVGSPTELITRDEALSMGDEVAAAYDHAISTLKTINGYSLLPDSASALQARAIRKTGEFFGRIFEGSAIRKAGEYVGKAVDGKTGKVIEKAAYELSKGSAKVGQAVEKVGYGLSQNSAADITVLATRLNYFRKIRMNPLSARMLNLSQMLANAGTPVSMGKAIVMRDAFMTVLNSTLDAMRGGKSWDDAYKTLDKTYVKTAARLAGVKPDEFGKLARAYIESGSWHRVTHNDMRGLGALSEEQLKAMKVGEVVDDSLGARAWGIAGRTGNSALRTLDALGIYGGEHEASVITYLTQYLNLRKNKDFNLSKQTSQQELAGITNSLMGEMTPEGRVWMQKDWWKMTTQFLAFPYKMFMMLTPGSLQLTPAQKIGVMISQSTLLGADALWHVGKFKEAVAAYMLDDTDLSPEEHAQLIEDYKQIEPLLEQGILGSYMNRVMHAIVAAINSDVVEDPSYTYQEYGFGDRYSLGASPVDSIGKIAAIAGAVNSVYNGNWPSTIDMAEILGGALPRDILEFSKRTSKLWGMTLNADVEARNDAFVAITKEGLEQVSPMITQYYKLKAQQRYEEEITARGLRNVAFENTADSWVTTALGVRTLDDIEATKAGWNSFFVKESKAGNQQQEVAAQGDKIFDAVFELVTKVPKSEEGSSVREAMLNRHNAQIKNMYAMMPEGDAQLVQEYVIKKIDAEVEKGSAQGKQIRDFMGEIDGLAYDDGGLGRVLYIMRQRAVEMSPVLQQRLQDWRDEYEQTNSRYQ